MPSSLPNDLEGLRGKKALRAAIPLGLSAVGVPAVGALLARRRLSSRGLAPRGVPTAGRSSVSGSLCTSLAPIDDWWYECLRREAVGLVNRDTNVSNMSRNITELLLSVRSCRACSVLLLSSQGFEVAGWVGTESFRALERHFVPSFVHLWTIRRSQRCVCVCVCVKLSHSNEKYAHYCYNVANIYKRC